MNIANNNITKQGFALPTVMIASVVMLMVLLSGLTASSSVNVTLKSQVDSRMIDLALEAGTAMAQACMAKNANTITWSNSSPLKPNTNCSGVETTTCAVNDTRNVCYVLNSSKARSAFVVGVVVDSSGVPTGFSSKGVLNSIRSSTGVSAKETSVTRQVSTKRNTTLTLTLAIAVGDRHACGITNSAAVYCWGANHNGQLGNGTIAHSSVPVLVSRGALPTGVTITSVGAGQYHTCAIGSDGKAYCWGRNDYGQLGNNTTTASSIPVAVAQGSVPVNVKLVNITGGQLHTCAQGSDGKAYCWGYNAYGQLGNNTVANSSVPVTVAQGVMPSGSTFKVVTTKVFHTCGIGSDDKAYCWGSNGGTNYNYLGNNGGGASSSVPSAVAQGAIPVGVSIRSLTMGGSYHTCAIGSDSKLYCWGQNDFGQLGNGNVSPTPVPVAVSQGAISSGSTFKTIETGYAHTCVTTTTGASHCWGYNQYGQLGNGSITNSASPVAMAKGAIPAGVSIDSMGVGTYHSCGMSSQNKIYCWGRNDFGQLGNGTTTDSYTPVAITSSLDWRQNTGNVESILRY